jgi:hypothetical protein
LGRRKDNVIRDDVGQFVEPEVGEGSESDSLLWNALVPLAAADTSTKPAYIVHDDVESRDSVGSDK